MGSSPCACGSAQWTTLSADTTGRILLHLLPRDPFLQDICPKSGTSLSGRALWPGAGHFTSVSSIFCLCRLLTITWQGGCEEYASFKRSSFCCSALPSCGQTRSEQSPDLVRALGLAVACSQVDSCGPRSRSCAIRHPRGDAPSATFPSSPRPLRLIADIWGLLPPSCPLREA